MKSVIEKRGIAMHKPTKRKAFNFLRSYFDVLNELKTDEDKLSFLLSIINKQFLNEDPENLNFIVNLCYESQRHSVESSVKGWIRVNKDTPITDPTTNPPTNPQQEEEEEKEKEEVKEKEERVYSKEVNDCFGRCLAYFDSHLIPRTPKKENDWKDTIEKLNRIDGVPFEKIVEIVKNVRNDSFWCKNFLSLNKLRKKNKDGIAYIVVFDAQFKPKQVNEDPYAHLRS